MNDFDSHFYKIVGNKIRTIREAHNTTLKELSEELNLTIKTIQRYEMGERKIDVPKLKQITQVLGVPYDKFMDEVRAEQFPNDITLSSTDSQLVNRIEARPKLQELVNFLDGLDDKELDTIINLTKMMNPNAPKE